MRKIIAANWKMNKNFCEALSFAQEFVPYAKKAKLNAKSAELDIVIFPPVTSIYPLFEELKEKNDTHISLGVQNFYPATHGAFTGEISLSMLDFAQINWTLVGHSERRHILHESNELIESKFIYSLKQDFKTILCIGEKLEEHNQLEEILNTQIWQAIKNLDHKTINPNNIVIAYEPVWAIGTGQVASSDDIVLAHGLIRTIISKYFGSIAANIRILYGGSVNAQNANQIISLDNVDGLLIGGASLDVKNFEAIIEASL